MTRTLITQRTKGFSDPPIGTDAMGDSAGASGIASSSSFTCPRCGSSKIVGSTTRANRFKCDDCTAEFKDRGSRANDPAKRVPDAGPLGGIK